jgi:Protein of unknown function (DUF2867)
MTGSITQVGTPGDCLVAPIADSAHYTDSFSVRVPSGTFPDVDALARACTRLPGWVSGLMRLRNAIVAPLGLKTEPDPALKERSEGPLGTGNRVGIFRVLSRSTQELLFGENDKHLDFRFSLLLRERAGCQEVFATTTVHFHNGWGRFYFLFVAPVHRLIIPAMLRSAVRKSAG